MKYADCITLFKFSISFYLINKIHSVPISFSVDLILSFSVPSCIILDKMRANVTRRDLAFIFKLDTAIFFIDSL